MPILSRLAASFGLVALFLGLTQGAVADTIVYSNNASPGDLVSDPGSLTVPIGSGEWTYNVYGGGAMGIRTDFARSGNGSVLLSLSGSNAESDLVYWTGNSLGSFASLNALSYDWYRDSSSTNDSIQAPATGVYVSNNGGVSGGWIIYEPYYNNPSPPPPNPPWAAPVDQWVTSDAYNGGAGQFWSTITGSWTQQSLSTWQTSLTGYDVYAVVAFAGSGWSGQFTGAVDNVSFGFVGSAPVTYNFEVVPEPSSIAMSIIAGGIGLLEVARRRLRRPA